METPLEGWVNMKEALFYKVESNGKVSCFLCNHKCLIAEGQFGLCRVRQNLKGILYSLNYGKLAASHVDPVEKKPLYHFLPGSSTYSIASIGCNFACDFCQNWQISQVDEARKMHAQEFAAQADEVVNDAVRSQCKSISYTYTEPTVYFEFAYECILLAQKKKLKNVFLTNGYMSEIALQQIAPHLDAANVDLKSFKETFYRTRCTARLTPVLDNIRLMKKLGIEPQQGAQGKGKGGGKGGGGGGKGGGGGRQPSGEKPPRIKQKGAQGGNPRTTVTES